MKPVGWVPMRPPSLQTAPPPSPPAIQARLLAALPHHHPPQTYIPYLSAHPPRHPWPQLIASCLTPLPSSHLTASKHLLKALPLPAPVVTEMLPEPLRGLAYTPPPPGYASKVVPAEREAASTPQPNLARKPSVGEVIRLGTGMQPTLSRRRSVVAKASLPRVRNSMFLSGRKSEKVRLAEEKEREEREAEKAALEERERQAERDGGGGERPREYLDLEHDSDLDFTVRDAADIERMEGMDEDMIRTQRDKEARPRHVGEIVKKMHSTAAGTRNVVPAVAELPVLADTGYARVLRREEQAKKRLEQAEAAREKERVLVEQRRDKFNRRRRRKLRKAGKVVQSESEEEETSPAPDPEPPEEASHSTTHYETVTSADGRGAQRRRTDPGGRYDPPSDDRYLGEPYDDRPHDDRRRYDDRQAYPPPHDPRRPEDRPPQWQSPQHPYHHPPPHYAPPSPYYAPPSPFYGYHSQHYYHPPPHPPHQYYSPARAPQRLDRNEFEKRRRQLYEEIGGFCGGLHADDARVIDDFLDNQEYMFRDNERTKYFLLEQTGQEEVLLRIDRETRRWEVRRNPRR